VRRRNSDTKTFCLFAFYGNNAVAASPSSETTEPKIGNSWPQTATDTMICWARKIISCSSDRQLLIDGMSDVSYEFVRTVDRMSELPRDNFDVDPELSPLRYLDP